ncbi:MAG: peptidyl-prolyl cis-trans isomerase [Bacteroidota bacterium]
MHARQSQSTDSQPVARVYNQYLYKNDLEHLIKETNSAEDTAKIVEKYIQRWISKQLLLAEAEAHSEYNKADIERRVLDYRNTLLVHDFIERLVSTQLNKEVSKEEIASYYQAHQEDFVLRSNIFRGRFIILPKNAPRRAQLRSLIMGRNNKQLEALKSYCLQFAHNYALDETVWLPWDELVQGTSLKNARNKARLLGKGKLLVTSGADQRYYFKIDEYKRVGDVAPLEFVSDQIVDLIIYKRKIDLAKKSKQDILQQAKKNNNYVIYEH